MNANDWMEVIVEAAKHGALANVLARRVSNEVEVDGPEARAQAYQDVRESVEAMLVAPSVDSIEYAPAYDLVFLYDEGAADALDGFIDERNMRRDAEARAAKEAKANARKSGKAQDARACKAQAQAGAGVAASQTSKSFGSRIWP